MIYGNNAGDTIVDIYFKSGEEVEVNAFTDEGDSIPDGLADCFLAAMENPEILTRPYPVNLIGCDTVEGIEYFFDGNAVEYYITGSVSEEDMVELHFASGNVIEVLSTLDENPYPGESVETLVDNSICRYLPVSDGQKLMFLLHGRVTISCFSSMVSRNKEFTQR